MGCEPRQFFYLGVIQVRVGRPAVPGRADQRWLVVVRSRACSLEISRLGFTPAGSAFSFPGFDRGGELEGSWRKLGGSDRLHRRNDGLPRLHPPAAAAQASGPSGPRASPCRLLQLVENRDGVWRSGGADPVADSSPRAASFKAKAGTPFCVHHDSIPKSLR